jgi:8-oxo-dGTP diphosphatase
MMDRYPVANPLLLITAVALIDEERRVLVQLRPEGKPLPGLWEFPGGKVETGEVADVALVRELQEELSIDVKKDDLEPFTFACEPLADRQLLLLLYVCRTWSGVPKPLVASELKWCRFEELEQLAMPPADVPLLKQLRHVL